VARAVGVAAHEGPRAQALPRLQKAQPREEEGAGVDAQHHLELVHLVGLERERETKEVCVCVCWGEWLWAPPVDAHMYIYTNENIHTEKRTQTTTPPP
jgi:hypothetical protein